MAQWMQCNWIQQTPTWADSVCNIRPSGGYGPTGAIPSGRRRTPEELRRERVRLGILPEQIIENVALRQTENLRLDEQQRFEELQGELRLQGIEMESAHLAVLNARREQLINAEIARRIMAKMDEEAVILLLFMAASI